MCNYDEECRQPALFYTLKPRLVYPILDDHAPVLDTKAGTDGRRRHTIKASGMRVILPAPRVGMQAGRTDDTTTPLGNSPAASDPARTPLAVMNSWFWGCWLLSSCWTGGPWTGGVGIQVHLLEQDAGVPEKQRFS